MGPKKTFHLRDALLLILVLALVLGVVYKYFEWKTLKGIISDANSMVVGEYSDVEKSNIFYNTEAQPLVAKIFSDKIKSPEDYIAAVDELRNKMKVNEDMDKSYLSLVNDNRAKIFKYKLAGMFLLGRPRIYVNNFVENSLASYDAVIFLSKTSSVQNKFLDDFFMVSRDMAISNAFSKDAPPYYNQTLVKFVQNNYSKLGVLEKYTRDDFKFADEEEYKINDPYGYDILLKYRDYLKSYYLIMKDLAVGDIDSATYKYSKFQNQSAAINVDFEKLFSEKQDEKNTKTQESILATAKMVKAYKDFNNSGLKVYPLLGGVGKFKADLALCGVYNSKIDLFKNITSDYPTSTNTERSEERRVGKECRSRWSPYH